MVPFEAVFGNIEIPIASIQVVDFAVVVNGTKTHRVQFLNGDMLTGYVGRVAPMKFETSYGTLIVPMETMLRMSCGGPAATDAQANVGDAGSAAAEKTSAVKTSWLAPRPDGAPPGPVRPLRGVPVPDDEVE